MNAHNAFNPDLDEQAEFPKLKAAHGEDPARFLQSSKDLAFARIRGIRDPELLTAYAAVAKQILSGSEKRDVLEAIDARSLELTDEPTPEPTDSRATATDGGELLAESRSSSEVSSDVGTLETDADSVNQSHDLTTTAESDATSSPSDSASDPDEIHPDCKGLEAGQALELERADRTEYIFPSQPAADEPFCYRSFDGEGDECTADPIPLSLGEVASRPINDTDPKPVSETDKRAPTLAATNGGDS